MQARLIHLVCRFSVPVLLLVLALAAAALGQLIDVENRRLTLKVDSSLTGLLPVAGGQLETYRRVQQQFGGDDVLLVAWFDDAFFSADVLRRYKRFTRRVQRIDGVDRVDGLASALYVRSTADGVRVDRLLRRIPRDAAGLAALREEATTNPLYRGQFVSQDGRGALVAVHFDADIGSAALARAVADIARASREEAGGVEQFISGPVHARLETSNVLFRDIRKALPVAILVTAIIAAISLRNVRGVILPLLSTGFGLAVTLALFSFFGNALNFVTAIVPPVVFVIGFAFAIHVVTEFDRTYTARDDKLQAVQKVLGEVFVPLTLTAVTTTVGFASLATSPIGSIRLFGIYTALGTVLCWAAALALIPAALLRAPVRPARRVAGDTLANLAPRLARFNLRYRKVILACGCVLAIAALASASRLDVSTDYLRNFSQDNPVRTNFERIRGRFAGAVPIQVVFTSEVPGAFSDPLHLATLHAFEHWLEQQPEVGAATSLVDFLQVLNRAFAETGSDPAVLPATPGGIEDLMFLAGGNELGRFVDARRQSTLLHVQTSAVSSNDLSALINRIEAQLATLPGPIDAEVTGSSALLARTLDDIVIGQLTSLLGAMLVIYIILILLFGSLRIGALALLPNMLPIICFFGLLGLSGITLNLATSLVAAVVLGIAVDDTMHFLSRFNAEARRVADEAEGIERALGSVIRPVTFTSAALCCGFLALTLGELRSQIEFGALAAVTLLIAWVIDLTFTPALAGWLRFVTLWEVMTVDLGAAPHKSIPFFGGLSNRQARIAAILGNLETFERGDSIMTTGDSGRDIHVIIEGEAVAYVGRDDKEQILRRLTRGDLLGEVALFHGHRTANVAATTRVRLLRLEQSDLRRIQTRYPRIAAQLYHNLGVILADRLADVTGRL